MAALALALSLAAAAPAPAASERAAFHLAIAATHHAPPDLVLLLVAHRKEFLMGVREAAGRAPAADFRLEGKALSSAIWQKLPVGDLVHRFGTILGEVIAAEAPAAGDAAGREAWESAAAGPYRYAGVCAGCAAGDAAPVAAAIARSRSELSHAKPDALASRIVTDETNLLWAIWTGAGGDARPARKLDERNGPYTVPAATR